MSYIPVALINLLLTLSSLLAIAREPHQATCYQDVSWSADGSKLLFSSNRDGNFDLWLADSDGAHLVNLTRSPARDVYGGWSPDGKTIAFASDRNGLDAIYLMTPDGANLQRLTNPEDRSSFPSWSPDGKKIAFMSQRDGNSHIYVMDADGTNQTRLTDQGGEANPQWSPDGTLILFESRRADSEQIYVMRPDGSQVTPLTSTGHNIFPGWSPDGSAVVFANHNNQEPGANGLYVMVLDDFRANPVNEKGCFARWSPDGKRLAVIEGQYPQTEIIVMEPDGSGHARVTE